MTTLKQFCNICEHDHISTVAITWCPECEDFLCSSCDRFHAGSNASKQHVVIKIEDYQKLPASILSIKNRCRSHNNKYEFYCTTHGEPCCVICTQNEHRDCQQLCPIHEVTDNAKSSTAIEHLEKDLVEINSAFETVKSIIKTNITENYQQQNTILTEISKVRKSINDHLDKIEREVTHDLLTMGQKLQETLQRLLSDMEGKKTKFNDIRQEFETMKQYAGNLQTCIGVAEMVAKTDGYVKKLQGALEYDYYRLECDIQIGLQSIEEKVPSFGIVSVAHKSCERSLISGVKLQVQIPTPRRSNATPTIARKTAIQLPTGNDVINIKGSEILPDGKLLFADIQSNKLIMCFADGKYEKDISLPSTPFEVKCTDKNDVVAVTLPEKQEIVFVNVTTNVCIFSVNTVHRCFGSDTNSQKLVVRALPTITSSHVIFFSLKGDFLSRVYIPGWTSTNISVGDDVIICSDWNKNTVYAYTSAGETLWTYTDQNVLCRPIGIAIDKSKHIFVAGKDSHNVVVLSPVGQFCTELLSERDGLKKPYSLRINIDRNELLVCNQDGQAFLFSLSYDY